MLLSLVLVLQPPLQDAGAETAAAQMHFRGELLRRERDGFSPIDDFELIRFRAGDPEKNGYVLLQAGIDRAIWPASVGPGAPRIRHTHDGVLYRLDFVALSFEKELQEGQVWTSGRKTFRVGSDATHKGRVCCEVQVNEGPARNHRLLVEKKSGAVVFLEQRVFMGRGDEFRLTLDVRDGQQQHAAADTVLFDRLLKLRRAIEINPDKPDTPLTAEQGAVVASALPGLHQTAASRWAKKFVARVDEDTKSQLARTEKLADLKSRSINSSLPAFRAASIRGKTIDSKEFADKVVILHFWKYRDDPLSEPYGQTAYLDFLSGRNAGKAVRVVGVNVDPRYGDKAQSGKARRSARKLVEFMNLSYEIVGDDGSLLKKLGDPRSAGATLPLWIVVDKTGKIRLWKSGYYEVDARRGLKELQHLVDELQK